MPERIVITGGMGALAQAIAAEFDNSGWIVEAPGRDELDVSCSKSVATFFSSRDVDLLICAAGIIRDAPLAKLSESDWDNVLETNLIGSARCAKAAAHRMLQQRKGHLVFISSYSALHPPKGQAAYAASKAGLIGLSHSLAIEYGSVGIRSNVLLPGFITTPMTSQVSSTRRANVRAEHVLGRFNTPCCVARFIRFLEEDLPHTSGQVFQLDSRVT